jgi:hypothetical protein
MTNAPDKITVEFLQASGEPVRLGDLGPVFLAVNNISSADPSKPFKVGIQQKTSQKGNAFYSYQQNGIPLPDGLNTFVRVEGGIVPMGRTRPSQAGYPTREGSAQVIIGETVYSVTVFLTEGKTPFFVKIHAQKTPDRSANVKKAQQSPRGGKIEV